MEQRISLITLGVTDLKKSREFYKKLGWQEAPNSDDDICFYQLNGVLIALYPMNELLSAQDTTVQPAPGGITIAINTRSHDEVDKIIDEFIKAGGKVIKPAHEFPWAYSGYVSDLDGHSWEISYVPSLIPDESGNMKI